MPHAQTRPVLERATLETSLKPFHPADRDSWEQTARALFEQWTPLLRTARTCSVLLWVSDGSEILDWAGDLDDELEWARYIGFCNTGAGPYGEPKEPGRVAVPYRDGPATLRYADVAELVAILRRVGTELGRPTEVGATFDPGPEFAPSSFKYERHPEVVARGEEIGIGPIIQMVRHFSTLHADERRYAAFPDGIVEGTSFGEFLGRQAQHYVDALGFDYLWLSNGFGFSSYAWSELGETFDGARFRSERVGELRDRALGFWADLHAHLRVPVEVRGTNQTAGIDIGADAVPALEIYERGHVASPPPNSPWGPLNEDFGIELAGFMSRIAHLPRGSAGYRFRFYANDPWFWQQPWWDFYDRQPFDIDLPLAVSRLDQDGTVHGAREVNVLTVDTAHGVLDERCGREVGGYVARALEARPDAAGPLVWVYPFREYHEAMAADPSSIARPHAEDWALTAAINAGLPLNTVVSTDALPGAHAAGALASRVLVVPAGALADHVVEVLDSHARAGGTVVVHGSTAGLGARALDLLGVGPTDAGVAGALRVRTALGGDRVRDGELPRTLHHEASVSHGDLTEQVRTSDVEVLVTVEGTGGTHPWATSRGVGAGHVLWARGSAPFTYAPPDARGVRAHVGVDRSAHLDPGALLRDVVGTAGLTVGHELRTPASGRVVLTVHRSDGAWWFAGYLADTTTSVRLGLPDGAPLLTQHSCWFDDGGATYHLTGATRAECRVLVRRARHGTLRCREVAPYPADMSRALQVEGLHDADVALELPPAARLRLVVAGQEVDCGPAGTEPRRHELRGVTGTLTLSWQELDR